MKYLEKVYNNISLKEDISLLANYLFYIYVYERLSNKKLSVLLNIPIPLVVAIKKEFFKLKILEQKSGISFTEKGKNYIESDFDLKNLDRETVKKIFEGNYILEEYFREELGKLREIFDKRPDSNLMIDQTECTPETSLRRGILAISNNSLINKNILCIGDDDLVSISISLLLKKLFPDRNSFGTHVCVLDIDMRFSDFIVSLVEEYELPNIEFVQHDLIEPLPKEICGKYDTVFTDPPYTENGLKLFVYRAKKAFNPKSEGKLFLSFAEKDNDFNFEAQNLFLSLNFIIENIYSDFNQYIGGNIIGNRSNMTVLTSLPDKLNAKFADEIYTGSINKKLKEYKCKSCKTVFILGEGEKYRFIEELKNNKCPNCRTDTFQLIRTIRVK